MENEQTPELGQEVTEEPGRVETEALKPEAKLTPEQELGIKRRNFSRLAEELGVEVERPWIKKPETRAETPKPAEKKSFDDTEQLVLDVKQVPEEDRAWLFEEYKTTGKPIRQLLDFKYVQEHLKEAKENRKTEAAIPEPKNRSGISPSSTFDHWWAKLESGQVKLSQIPDAAIRKQVLERRIAIDRESKGIR